MIQLVNPSADLFIPDDLNSGQALGRTTHLGVGAHQDDLEVMALHGILACYKQPNAWFGGVTVTNGAGSSRANEYADYTDEQMQAVRAEEQRKASVVGEYSFIAQLDYPSSAVKQPSNIDYAADLRTIFAATKPNVVYTHNLADKHDTHVAVSVPLIQVLRELPTDDRPEEVYGVEVWRDLNWMPDQEKVLLNLPNRPNLVRALISIFDSQISGGKRYDLALEGRLRSNATFFDSHAVDAMSFASYAMDLKPLVDDPSMNIAEYVDGYVKRFREDVRSRVSRFIGD
ncbi:MAG: PIG-L family deacetylase [Verrucomicrobiota bacterium]|jgi:LmbE family N-acetylglucosaminyl deacetylase|nr:PIG-L family deacetylase [Verrucomicrobiota bacterium]